MPKSSSKAVAESSEGNTVAHFEKSLAELEELVVRMEGGQLNLEDSLRSFERGIALYRSCQTALAHADTRVKLLLDPAQPGSAQPFSAPEES